VSSTSLNEDSDSDYQSLNTSDIHGH